MKLNSDQYNAIWDKLRETEATLKSLEAQLAELIKLEKQRNHEVNQRLSLQRSQR